MVKGQGPTKVITVRDTLPYGHASTYQIPLTYMYLERQKSYGPDKPKLTCNDLQYGVMSRIIFLNRPISDEPTI
jgi:hypothetical protein